MLNKISREEYQIEYKKMLTTCVEIFEKIGINYSLAYGTLLGAYREGDIIPWDHDIDLFVESIPKEKILLLENELKGQFYIETYHRNEMIYFLHRICNPRLKFKGSDDRVNNAWIDLFEIIPTKKDRYSLTFVKKMPALFKIFSLKELRNGRNKFITALRKIIFHLVPSRKRLNNRVKMLFDKLTIGNDFFTGYTSFSGKTFDIVNFDSKINFGGREYKCIDSPESFLIKEYGNDYMIPKKYQQGDMEFYLEISH